MTLDQALKRIGITIVKAEQKPTQVVLLLRVNTKFAAYWTETLTEYLLASLDERVSWSTDVSKYFYPVRESGVVRYLWRVVLNRDPKGAAEALGRAAQRAIADSVEVTSQPLVGRKTFEYDPATGKIGGAHPMKQAASLLANGLQK